MRAERLQSGQEYLRQYGAVAVLILMIVVNSLFTPNFFAVGPLWNVLLQSFPVILISLGMSLVIITGGIDLSVSATVALCGILAAQLSASNLALAILLPLAVGTLVGLVNGIVITKLKIVPFIATLAVQMAVRGISYLVTDMQSVPVPDEASTFIFLGRGYIAGMPAPVLFFLVAAIVLAFVIQRTSFGRSLYAIGGNDDAARMMGVLSGRNQTICYMITGLLSGLAGVILCARLGAGQPVAAEGWEMDAIASVAIGGTLLTGGVGGVWRTVWGVLIIGFIKNIINLQGNVNSYWQNIIMGLILLVVIILQNRTMLIRIRRKHS